MTGKFEIKYAMLILAIILMILQYAVFGFNIIPWEHRLGNLASVFFGVYVGMRINDIFTDKPNAST